MSAAASAAASVTRRVSDLATKRDQGGFLDHLEALRRKLLVVLGCFLLTSIVAFAFRDLIFDLVFLPFGASKPQLIAIRPQEKFVTYLQLAAFAGAILSVPILILQLALFVKPALKSGERRPFRIIHGASHLFYIGGVAFSVLIIAPFALRFFLGFGADDGVDVMWSVAEYVRLIRGIVIGITIVFQTPLIMILLTSAGAVSADTFRRYRRHAIVIAFLVGAFLTPPDVFTQALVGGTLYAMFELSLLLARMFERMGHDGQT